MVHDTHVEHSTCIKKKGEVTTNIDGNMPALQHVILQK